MDGATIRHQYDEGWPWGLRVLSHARRHRLWQRRAAGMVLLYHRVTKVDRDGNGLASDSGTDTDADQDGDQAGVCMPLPRFRAQIAALARDCTVMPLGELFDTVRAGGRLPDRALALTFDDGWHDSFERALPVLREFSLPATFFVTGPRPDGSREFVDEATLRAAATDPLVGLGGHTVTHPHVSTLTLQTAVRELTENRIWLTELTGIKPRFFAYPYGETLIGDRDNESLIEAAGYEAAFTTQEGLLTHRTPVQALPRNDISAFGGPDVLAWLRHAFGED